MSGSSRHVFITGSARGIGIGIAQAFAANGDRVTLNARTDADQLNTSVEALRHTGADAYGLLADFSDYASASACCEAAVAAHGPVNVLVNNAGSAHFGLFTDMSPDEYDRVLHHNLYTVLHACRLFAPGMVRAKHGVIVNISSVWGIAGASCEAVYAAAKGAVNLFTKSLAKELGPSGVRVNAIACGAFETRMNERLSKDERDAFMEQIPLSRFGEPEEAGRLAVFLASEEAAYLTGQIIALDGGFL